MASLENPKVSQDEYGQWWYQRSPKVRLRMAVRKCFVCKQKFPIYPGKTNQTHCSKACLRQCRHSGKGHCNDRYYHFEGEQNGQWKGGRFIDQFGYVHVRIGVRTREGTKRKWTVYEREHRLVMEQMLSRKLRPGENVHHRNGIRDDNRPENLELWVKSQPSGQRFSEKPPHCDTCTCFS